MITSTNKRYATLIVTFNRKDLLLEAIQAVQSQTLPAKSIVIVDNASTDGTSNLLKTNHILDDPKIHLIELEQNLGGSGGFYYGLKYIQDELDVDWVAVSDDDAIYESSYFEKLFTQANKHADHQAIAGKVQFPDGEIQLGHRKYFSRNGRYSTQNVPEKEYTKLTFEADYASFVGLLLSVDLIQKIGLPHKDYFIWFDDIEYSVRIQKNTKLLIVSDATIVHKTAKSVHGQQNNHLYNWKTYYGIRNRLAMIKEHSTTTAVLVACIGMGKTLLTSFRSNRPFKTLLQTLAGLKDGLFGNLGKNIHYLP